MKKFYIVLLISFVSSFLFLSCTENFSPKADFVDNYVMYCVFQANEKFDSVYPKVFITKTYDTDGFYPPENHSLISVTGADVLIKMNDKSYTFIQDTTINSSDKTEQIYYGLVSASGIPIKQLSELSLTAKLPDNTVLTASTQVPRLLTYTYSYEFNTGFHTFMNKWLWGNEWTIDWNIIDGNLYYPKLVINYSVTKDSVETLKSVIVPNKYVKSGDGYVANYPSFILDGEISYDYAAIDSAMANISAGDTCKSDYSIYNITLEILEYDAALSKYFTSINGYMDNLSIRLDETVYSNVSGGIGIFATYLNHTTTFSLNKGYPHFFGYKTKQ